MKKFAAQSLAAVLSTCMGLTGLGISSSAYSVSQMAALDAAGAAKLTIVRTRSD